MENSNFDRELSLSHKNTIKTNSNTRFSPEKFASKKQAPPKITTAKTIEVEETDNEDVSNEEKLTFSSFNLDPQILNSLNKMEIVNPTPIQAKAIPLGLEGKDIIGIAQTGTGKTLAFALPIIQNCLLQEKKRETYQALILVPTRELAEQVEETFYQIAKISRLPLSTAVLIGGASMQNQYYSLRKRPNIIVATPGRLQDHLNQRNLSLSKVATVVLDEADRMFDVGFAPQIRQILKVLPAERQTMLFSATMPPEVLALTKQAQVNPVRLEISPQGTSVKKIVQEICYVKPEEKMVVLKKILEENNGTTIIFSRTKHGAKALTQKIGKMGFPAAEIHSNRSLNQRRDALRGFKNGKYQVLVATDIAARGIDVDDIQLVLNYDLPDSTPDYVHRIGRTGRAGKEGRAISLATIQQYRNVKDIEILTKSKLIESVHSIPLPVKRFESENSASRPKVLYRSGGRGGFGGRGRR